MSNPLNDYYVDAGGNSFLVCDTLEVMKFDTKGNQKWDVKAKGDFNTYRPFIIGNEYGDMRIKGQFYSDSVQFGKYKIKDPDTGNFVAAIYDGCHVPANIFVRGKGDTTCGHNDIVLYAVKGSGAIYNWYQGSTLVGNTDTLLVTTPGTYKLSVSNGYCTNSASINTTIFSQMNPTKISYNGDSCEPGLMADSSHGYALQWYRNGQALPSATRNTLRLRAGGYYSIMAYSIHGCSQLSDSVFITYHYLDSASFTHTGDTILCDGDSVVLKAITGTNYSWQWQMNDTDIAGATESFYSAKSTGLYKVKISYAAGCSRVSPKINIIVNPRPVAAFSFNNDSCSPVLSAKNINNCIYQWYRNDTALKADTGIGLIPGVSGKYSVILTNQFGCSKMSAAQNIPVHNMPAVNISWGGDSVLCDGDSVKLQVPSGKVYTWFKNDSEVNGANLNIYEAMASGKYIVKINYTGGCSKTTPAVKIKINPSPIAAFSFNADSCSPFLLAKNNNNSAYQWYKNDTLMRGDTGQDLAPPFSANFSVQITNQYGCTRISNDQYITVRRLDSAYIIWNNDSMICSGDSVVLKANTGTNYIYQWQRNGTDISSATQSSFAIKQSGFYTVKINFASGCSKTSVPLKITANPSPAASFSYNSDSCSPVLTAKKTKNTAYLWYRNDTLLAGDTLLNFTPAQSGNYKVQATNNFGCSNMSASQYISVHSIPSAPITASGDTIFCQGDSVLLQASKGSGYKYQWLEGNTNINGAIVSAITVKKSGSYSVEISNSFGCKAYDGPVNVKVNPLPDTPVITLKGDSLYSSAAYGNQWYFRAKAISGATDSKLEYSKQISGMYTVVVTDSNGCSATSADFEYAVTGIERNRLGTVLVYPNPGHNLFTITLPDANFEVAELTDVLGRVVARFDIRNEKGFQISASELGLSKGIYLLTLKNEVRVQGVKVVVVE